MTIYKQTLQKYCNTMLLDATVIGESLVLDEKKYLIIDEDALLFDEEGDFLPQDQLELEENIFGYVFLFGGRWYIHKRGEDFELIELCYIGQAKEKLPTKSFLGIRSGFELMNGMGLYKAWIKKAKFLGVEALGICERNTLGGVLSFQNECRANGIKSIIGMTMPIEISGTKVDIKVYAKNFQGWLSLLKFNTILNVDQRSSVSMPELLKDLEGVFLIADPKCMTYDQALQLEGHVDFYQLDTVNFLNEEKDEEYLNNLERYMCGEISPISIADAFYLEKVDFLTRESLWTINKAFDDRTDNQYFKSKSQYAGELVQMFEPGNKSWVDLYKLAIANEAILVQECNFQYDTDTRHLPKYIMTEEEAKKFKTNEALFIYLVKKGLKDRKVADSKIYIDRLLKEIEVLKMGDVIDYFLSLHDIISYAKREKMLTGIGRGSAGGSLVAYLLGIIQVDPLRFDLLFERFLNSGRMGEMQDRPLYVIETDEATIELAEGALVRIIRDQKETVVFVHELLKSDEILRY